MGGSDLQVISSRPAWGRVAAVSLALLSGGCATLDVGNGAAVSGGPAAATSGSPATVAPLRVEVSHVSSSPFGDYLAGRHASSVRDMGAAADMFSKTLAHDPANPDLLRRTFYLMAAEGRMDEAMELARRLVKARPDTPIAGMALAVKEVRAGDFRAAEERLRGLPRNGFNDFIVPMLLAWALAGQDKPDEAVAALKPLADSKGLELLLDFHTALINDLAGDAKAAEESYAKAVAADAADYVRLVEAVGTFYERMGEAEKARALYTQYEVKHPDTTLMAPGLRRISAGGRPEPMVGSASDGMAEALFNLASLLQRENVREISLILARLSLHLRPRLPIVQLLIAEILESQGRKEDALEAYDSVDFASPVSWSARLGAALLLDDLDRTEAAVSRLRAMADERKARADALIALGNVLRASERYTAAVEAYDEAVGRIPKLEKRHWSLLYTRGIARERTQQWARAEADFLRALEFEPDQPYVLNYLGYSWAEQGVNLEKAFEMVDKAVKQRPNDGYIVDSMGWVLYRMGKFEGAVTHLERAVEVRPEDPTINDHLGDAYWRVGRQTEARFQWRRALSLKPEPETIALIEAKLKHGLADAKVERKAAHEGEAGRGG